MNQRSFELWGCVLVGLCACEEVTTLFLARSRESTTFLCAMCDLHAKKKAKYLDSLTNLTNIIYNIYFFLHTYFRIVY